MVRKSFVFLFLFLSISSSVFSNPPRVSLGWTEKINSIQGALFTALWQYPDVLGQDRPQSSHLRWLFKERVQEGRISKIVVDDGESRIACTRRQRGASDNIHWQYAVEFSISPFKKIWDVRFDETSPSVQVVLFNALSEYYLHLMRESALQGSVLTSPRDASGEIKFCLQDENTTLTSRARSGSDSGSYYVVDVSQVQPQALERPMGFMDSPRRSLAEDEGETGSVQNMQVPQELDVLVDEKVRYKISEFQRANRLGSLVLERAGYADVQRLGRPFLVEMLGAQDAGQVLEFIFKEAASDKRIVFYVSRTWISHTGIWSVLKTHAYLLPPLEALPSLKIAPVVFDPLLGAVFLSDSFAQAYKEARSEFEHPLTGLIGLEIYGVQQRSPSLYVLDIGLRRGMLEVRQVMAMRFEIRFNTEAITLPESVAEVDWRIEPVSFSDSGRIAVPGIRGVLQALHKEITEGKRGDLLDYGLSDALSSRLASKCLARWKGREISLEEVFRETVRQNGMDSELSDKMWDAEFFRDLRDISSVELTFPKLREVILRAIKRR